MTRRDDSQRLAEILIRSTLTAVLICALILVGLATATAAATRSQPKPTVLTSYAGKWGKQLVVQENGQKLTLYVFSRDHGRSLCYGRCQKVWRPLIAHGRIVAASSRIDPGQIRTATRRDGVRQVTYYGYPLYRCTRNKRTGQDYGAESWQFGGSWGVMSTDGSPLPPTDYGPSKPIPGC